ncbi:DAO-domain-containing protein [Coniophora puteana RWD-64-598 SS2]|uniref:DAO-domain-containing protein n=1 Tax=Coniophora puteana (strain RWD-64-598) TaxID=741705 RepID=A0A5M3MDG2_CONPW|nr:DAO-domain-containing protein [Coniophora puteana RWD-64-598 SS2]EIW77067.1 DAO-domain-containing protein [Coniophora puteana RWD-64-598 SS2]
MDYTHRCNRPHDRSRPARNAAVQRHHRRRDLPHRPQERALRERLGWRALPQPGDEEQGAETAPLFSRFTQTEYRDHELKAHWLEEMPDFEYQTHTHTPSSLPKSILTAYSFTTLSIHPTPYLAYLQSRFLAAGGKLVRGTVQHLAQLAEGGAQAFESLPAGYAPSQSHTQAQDGRERPHAIIACPGLGARSIGGIEDKSVAPMRGQTVLLRAPWLKHGCGFREKVGRYTYVVPRPDGTVLVGCATSSNSNDWYHLPRPHTTHEILQRALALVPDLAPPPPTEKSDTSNPTPTPTDRHPLILETGCGLSPARGGSRAEVEWIPAGPRPSSTGTEAATKEEQTRIPVVFNYGHAGYGFSTSWGSANLALRMLDEALAVGSPPPS